jgi:Fe-S cluster biogenesis protein NfuA
VDATAIERAIDPLLEALRADGGDLEVVTVEDGTIVLRLHLEDASCAECVMPADVLEPLLRDSIAASGQPVERVQLLDPRRAAS